MQEKPAYSSLAVVIKSYEELISRENLLEAFFRFRSGKRSKVDVAEFTVNLGKEIETLHQYLSAGTYRHGGYRHFVVNDPKRRDIHKASVRDRVVHHAVHVALYPYFDRKFIFDSYSCREGKGTHKALIRFTEFTKRCSLDQQKTVYVLKGDIRKFFASINHDILLQILRRHITDERIMRLITEIVGSFETTGKSKVGLPLGNLTSQLLVNIYMNEFDQFLKHKLKVKYYIRYADDFVCLADDRRELELLIPVIETFLHKKLNLEIHPDKLSILKVHAGVDFLGWVHFSHHLVLRRATKNRMLRNLASNPKKEIKASYQGLLLHGNTRKLAKSLGMVK